ncbi:hypothetical protein KSP40_PGU002441 [Platanthera guangdongensis]|uniref:Uncharacterized protein n=1 Tax=Platanthera guangdongensis TaxID=2320717 RepID=A0ABR2LKC7_9ASPA
MSPVLLPDLSTMKRYLQNDKASRVRPQRPRLPPACNLFPPGCLSHRRLFQATLLPEFTENICVHDNYLSIIEDLMFEVSSSRTYV